MTHLYSRLITTVFAAAALLAPSTADCRDLFGLCVTPYWPDVPNHGVCYTPEMAEDIRQLGAQWMRCEFICTREGDMDLVGWDEIITRAQANGLQIIGLLDYSTLQGANKDEWASSEYAAQFAKRAAFIANRYKNQVRVWEIWNEPNLPDFKLEPEPYAALLALTYRAIKSVDNRAVVCAAGLAGCWSGENNLQAKQYLEELYESAACRAFHAERGFYPFDAVADHPYAWNRPPSAYLEQAITENILSVMRRYGDGAKPIYITEIGWDVDPQSPTRMGPDHAENERKQAEWITELYRLVPTLKREDGSPLLSTICLYTYQAPSGFGLREFGSDRQRPSYEAYRRAAGGEHKPADSK